MYPFSPYLSFSAMPLQLQQLSVPCRLVSSSEEKGERVMAGPNSSCILFTCSTQVSNTDAEAQQPHGDVLQELQPSQPAPDGHRANIFTKRQALRRHLPTSSQAGHCQQQHKNSPIHQDRARSTLQGCPSVNFNFDGARAAPWRTLKAARLLQVLQLLEEQSSSQRLPCGFP